MCSNTLNEKRKLSSVSNFPQLTFRKKKYKTHGSVNIKVKAHESTHGTDLL